MRREIVWAFLGIGALAAASVAMHELGQDTEHRELFAGTGPITEQQLTQRLESEGYSTVRISQDGRYFIATALKAGKRSRFVLESDTGREASLWYDDDD
jgi:hypothetical protein